jgi:hypothetical protein
MIPLDREATFTIDGGAGKAPQRGPALRQFARQGWLWPAPAAALYRPFKRAGSPGFACAVPNAAPKPAISAKNQ